MQIGSALASTLGQLVRMSEGRLRVIVACGAAGGIAATFNAPITGLFFGFEIVLREFSLDALFATILAAVTGRRDQPRVLRLARRSSPVFRMTCRVTDDSTYLLIAVLGLAGRADRRRLQDAFSTGSRTASTRSGDGRPGMGCGRSPEGSRSGCVLLVLPQMYGVGYPVMDRVLGGHYVLWFVV